MPHSDCVQAVVPTDSCDSRAASEFAKLQNKQGSKGSMALCPACVHPELPLVSKKY